MTTEAAAPGDVLGDLAAALGVSELVPLARGGQKFVLRARRKGEPVAVKALLVPPGPAFPEALRRAARETGVLAAVDSPRVARLLDEPRVLRFAGGVPYGVAWTEELLDGDDVDGLLGPRWPATEATRLLVHLAEALAALHGKGIVHRDLSPGNVRRRGDGRFCLMDPGLARRTDEDDAGDAHAIGTLGYRSPEHALGGVVRPFSDIYCVGILVHQALTGELPDTASPAAVFPQRPDVAAALADVVDRCLSADPALRFADGDDLLAELARHDEVFGPYSAGSSADAVAPAPEDPPTDVLDYGVDDVEGSITLRGGFGQRRIDVESVSRDQEPFAIRFAPSEQMLAPGLGFSVRTVELGDGRFTNCFELSVDLGLAEIAAFTDPAGFHLADVLGSATAGAAVSGSFTYISDDPAHQPAEPCFDLCVRDGRTVSLPTAAKPALLVGRDGSVALRRLDASGTVRIGEHEFTWRGSKTADSAAAAGQLVVYGAANCRVRYTPAKRTGFLRDVARGSNITPHDPDAIDLVVLRGVVAAVRPGGEAELFEGSYVLRGARAGLRDVSVGDAVRVLTVDDVTCGELASGFSVGPSVADAARGGELPGYGAELGLSPFLPGARYARTLIGPSADGGVLRLIVLDGAPLTRRFQGPSCVETAGVVADLGLDPERVCHLDGGQSSKLAFVRDGATSVFGSMHYLLWPKQGEGDFAWRGRQGRVLRSALLVRPRA